MGFELLPWLDSRAQRPDWGIASKLYGQALPGAFELACAPAARVTRTRTLLWSRVWHTRVPGGDRDGVHALWRRYFRVPARIEAQADGRPAARHAGLHCCGTDKSRQTIDANPVSVDDFIALATAFRPSIGDPRRLRRQQQAGHAMVLDAWQSTR